MKNAINYYYSLVTYDIRRIGKQYRFTVDGNEYLLCMCEYNLEELEEIYKLNVFLLQMNVFNHQIILNKDQQIITYINNDPYILMKVFVLENRKITLEDILLFNNLPMYEYFIKLRKNNWHDFWIKKMDYFEYQITELGGQYSLVKESFNYFIGMTETAISLLYKFDYNSNLIISHRRITTESTLQDLYNPLNIIIDSKVRDICEYFKHGLFYSKVNFSEMKDYLINSSLSRDELYIFYVRMLYPSFYFDLYEQIISGVKEDKELIKIISKISYYQKLLQDLYLFLKPYTDLPDIEWIIKT